MLSFKSVGLLHTGLRTNWALSCSILATYHQNTNEYYFNSLQLICLRVELTLVNQELNHLCAFVLVVRPIPETGTTEMYLIPIDSPLEFSRM